MKDLELFSIGSWTIFDHLLRVKSLPKNGETLPLDMPLEDVERIHFGDCSANIAVVAGALGLRVGLGMVVGDDFHTSGYAAHLLKNGVDLAGVEVIKGARSGHSFNFFDAANGGFCVSHLGLAEKQDTWQAPLSEIERAQTVVVSEMFSAYTLKALEHAHEQGALTAINGMIASAGAKVGRFLAAGDLLFLNREEARKLLKGLGIKNPFEILNYGPQLVIVTRGDEGSHWYSAEGETRMPAVPPEIFIDSTGAGDSFAAGVLCGLTRGLSYADAACFGATVASFILEAWGCQSNLPNLARAAERFGTHFGRFLPLCE